MARRKGSKVLTYKIRELIIRTHEQNQDWKAPKVLSHIWEKLKKEDPTISPTWPSLAAVQKVIREYKLNQQDDPRDKPWSIATMAQYNIPPETLPVILKVWAYLEKKLDLEQRKLWLTKVMTIRVAQWIARLYYVFVEQFTRGKQPLATLLSDDPILLLLLAAQYAHVERIVQLLGYPESYEDMLTLWKPDTELASEKGSWEIRSNELFQVYGIDKKSQKLLMETPLAQLLKVGTKGVKHERKHNTED
jgi:hypothetical protein